MYLGVDPGMSGGICLLDSSGHVAHVEANPESAADFWSMLYYVWEEHSAEGMRCVIEQVSGFIGKEQPGSSMFKFGKTYGYAIMAITALGIPYELVTPQRWQKGLAIPSKAPHTGKRERVLTKGKRAGETVIEKFGGESGRDFKRRLREKAQNLFPGISVTETTADAMLIATYCRRLAMGTLSG